MAVFIRCLESTAEAPVSLALHPTSQLSYSSLEVNVQKYLKSSSWSSFYSTSLAWFTSNLLPP